MPKVARADPTSIWTLERTSQALRLYLLEGLSASEVAEALGGGLSRGAVLGKIRRLGFLKRDHAEACAARRAPPPAGARSPRVERRMPPQPPPIPLPPLRRVEPTGAPATLACLADNACRWPIDDPGPGAMHRTLFCGGAAPRGGYCREHRALARRSGAGLAATAPA